MLVPGETVKYIIDQHGLEIRGVVHMGAHVCEERHLYAQWNVYNVVWIDANPAMTEQNIQNGNPNCYTAALDETEHDAEFNVTNFTVSSSLLELGTHKIYYPDIVVSKKITTRTQTLPQFFERTGLDPVDYNFWNLDIQGTELNVLRGAEDLLEHVDIIYTEVNTEEVYKGCGLVWEIDMYLNLKGFMRVATEMSGANWGDALYVRTARKITPTLSIAIPTYNRFDSFLEKSLPKYLRFNSIKSILIGDETGDDIFKINQTSWGSHPKFKFIKNKDRLGAYHNKLNLLHTASTEWIALIDSDNELTHEYFIALYDYWEKHGQNEKYIYFAADLVQVYRDGQTWDRLTQFSERKIDKQNWNSFLTEGDAEYALNAGNCVFHKSVTKYLPVDLPKDQLVECKLMNKILVENGYTLVFVPGMKYYHVEHDNSLFYQRREEMLNYNNTTNWLINTSSS